MMRITIEEHQGIVNIFVEGRLASAWVPELAGCWERTQVSPERIAVDLSGLTSLDAEGRNLLEKMHRAGTLLVGGNGPLTRYIVEEIQKTA